MNHRIPTIDFIRGLAFILIACVRYISMVGVYYLVVYKFLKNRLKKFKINQEFPERKTVVQESKWALLNKVNFGFIGIGTFYLYITKAFSTSGR